MYLMKQAAEFRTAYGLTNNITHEMLQLRLIAEEFEEFRNAAEFERDEDCLKELADLVYVCAQYAANLGWDLDEAIARVHKSNLSKLGSDGKPLRRADGKVLKGPNYQPPDLTDLVEGTERTTKHHW
jgi:predicted HAD superfamily Cof-like phosphohydrolase